MNACDDIHLRVTRAALAEVISGFDPESVYYSTCKGTPCMTLPWGVSEDVFDKAHLLGKLAAHGPDKSTVCRTHAVVNRPDLWAQCALIPVRDALAGHTCGVTTSSAGTEQHKPNPKDGE